MRQQVTVTEHLLFNQRKSPHATGRFTRLLYDLVLAAKVISREVNKAGLVDVLGFTGDINVQGEQVKKLDEFANTMLVHRMQRSGVVCAMASEEMDDYLVVPREFQEEPDKAEYILVFDPLDGSSNIDVNVNIGTIFSILRRVSDPKGPITDADLLQPGSQQVAAGYVIYGSSTMLVLTTGDGVHGFTLDPSVGEFLLSHPDIKTPQTGKVYSVNEAYWHWWDDATRRIVSYFKSPENKRGKPYSGRYIGSLVADFHRNLLEGGIFMYPVDYRDPLKPKGKLRLLYEASPLAMVVEQAGGMASDGWRRILDLDPQSLHQRVPLFIGSANDVRTIMEIYVNEAAKTAHGAQH